MALGSPFVYYGTSAFSRRLLQGLLLAGWRPSRIVTTAPKPAGRGLRPAPSPVAALGRERGLPVLEVRTLKTAAAQHEVTRGGEPLALLAAFGKIIPAELLRLYPRGIVNVHPSLLPAYRGPAPIQRALLDDVPATGVTLILLDEEIDHGPILAQTKLAIAPADDAPALTDKLADLAVKLLLDTLPGYLAGRLTPEPQNHARASFTTMVKRDDGCADFTKSAAELDRTRRAFAPWPGLWTTWRGQRLKLTATRVVPHHDSQPGLVSRTSEGLLIGCARGALLVRDLQLEGGRVLKTDDFLRGHPDLTGTVVPS